jgi:hypothetical protein
MPTELALLLLLVALAIPFGIAISRSTELFVIKVREGKVEVVRGRLPPRLFEDIEDVLKRPPVEHGQLRVVAEQTRPKVRVTGTISEVQAQRIRNVVGRFDIAQIRSGRRRRRDRA